MLFPVVSHSPELVKKLNEEDPEPPGTPKLGIQERQEILLATLKKDGRLDKLKEWPPELAKKLSTSSSNSTRYFPWSLKKLAYRHYRTRY